MNENDANLMQPDKAFVPMCQGGEGSGNFGHEGRPGEVGGSGPGGGSTGLHFDKNGLLTAGHDESHYSSLMKEHLNGKNSEQWRIENLTENEQAATNNYSTIGYKQMNAAMRNDTIKDNPKLNREKNQIVKAISKSPPLREGTQLYRGTSEETANDLLSKSIGETFNEKGFQSYSLNPSIAAKFSKSGVIVRAIASGNERALPGHIGEHELIFAPKSSWQIIGKETIPKLGGFNMHIITVIKDE